MTKSEQKICQNCKQPFTIESEDFAFYERIQVPPPTFCPECREQRRIAFRNERALYKRKCDLCGESVVARVSPDKPYPMYCNKCWWGDGWDPLAYGKDYDFSRPFFEQYRELLFSTPHFALGASNNVDSDWVNQESDDKNCYLNVGGHFNQDSAYNTYALWSKDCFDNFWLPHGELCYESLNSERCYRTVFSRDCFDCQDVILSFDCRNCHHVFSCAGLRNKSYHIFNKPVSRGEYEEFVQKNLISSHRNLLDLQQQAEKVWLSIPHRDRFVVKCVNVSGDHITESKNAHNIWNGGKIEDSKHLFIAAGMKDCYDGTSIGWSELSYECAHTVGLYQSKFNHFSFGGKAEARQSTDIEYTYSAMNCHYCFGCANIKNKQYCILNKQYIKEEYEALVPKIKEHMKQMLSKGGAGRVYAYGENIPIELSPFGYNETAVMDYYPLTREEALNRGYPWSDYESDIKYDFSDYEIPDDIRDVKDDILDKILKCEISGKAYRIIPIELQFYRRMVLPIPRRAPLQRHKDRMARLLPRKLFDRQCQNCRNKIKTPYAPDRPEIVYCEQCYQSEIV